MSAKKILAVDFDAESLDFLSEFLRNEGYAVLTATDGISGLEKYESNQPDLVIMEAMLPRLHGFELCAKIAKEGRKTPVIILTGIYKDAVYKTEALRTFGASAYFEKPCPIGSFRTTLHRILGKPEPPAKKDDARETSGTSGKTSGTVSAQKTPSAASVKEPSRVNDEVEMMLKNALADIGWKPEKKTTRAATTPAASTSEREPKAEAKPVGLKPLVLKEDPIFKESPDFEPPPARAVAPPDEPDLRSAEFVTEKKKSLSSKVIAMAFVLLVVSSVGFLLLRPHQKSSPSESESAPAASWSAAADKIQTEPASDAQRIIPAENSGSPRTEPKGALPVKTATSTTNPTAADGPDPTAIKPLLPQAPGMKPQIQTPVLNLTDTSKSEAAEQSPADQTAGRSTEVKTGGAPPASSRDTNPGDLVPLEKVDAYPRVLESVEPVYPTAAKTLKMEGLILVNALISENGDVLQVQAVPGNSMAVFEKAAENAVKKWKFYPAQKEGVNVKVWKLISITFKLK
jgi:TonB family protein